MMLTAPRLRVIHVTTHLELLDAIALIESGLVERTIARGHDALVKAGIVSPRMGVCAINPHAGENGLFGRSEEAEKHRARHRGLPRQGLESLRPAAGQHPVLPCGARRFRLGDGD
jgi:4-hydroxy-L-threonine phosphate dehydrogenase PdxA